MTAVSGHRWGTLAAITLARMAFGYQVQTVASLGPDLVAAFRMDFALLGTLVGLYMLPGAILAIPSGFIARRFGDRDVVAAGLALMVAGSVVSAVASGPVGIGAGRLLAGSGAVAMTVLQGKIAAERFTGTGLTLALGLMVGAFPVGIGVAQLAQGPIAHAFGWPAAFLSGALLAVVPLALFLASWSDSAPAAPRTLSWPSRHECVLVIVSGLIWTAYNAGYANFMAYMPTLLAARGHPKWLIDATMTLATWGNLPAILLGGAVAARFGRGRVFLFGTVVSIVAVAGPAAADWPLLWGLLYGTLASAHSGLIVEIGTLSARPENRAVGMGLFYTTYYLGGAGLPVLCGRAADLYGDASGALLCAAALSALALPFYQMHFRRAAAAA